MRTEGPAGRLGSTLDAAPAMSMTYSSNGSSGPTVATCTEALEGRLASNTFLASRQVLRLWPFLLQKEHTRSDWGLRARRCRLPEGCAAAARADGWAAAAAVGSSSSITRRKFTMVVRSWRRVGAASDWVSCNLTGAKSRGSWRTMVDAACSSSSLSSAAAVSGWSVETQARSMSSSLAAASMAASSVGCCCRLMPRSLARRPATRSRFPEAKVSRRSVQRAKGSLTCTSPARCDTESASDITIRRYALAFFSSEALPVRESVSLKSRMAKVLCIFRAQLGNWSSSPENISKSDFFSDSMAGAGNDVPQKNWSSSGGGGGGGDDGSRMGPLFPGQFPQIGSQPLNPLGPNADRTLLQHEAALPFSSSSSSINISSNSISSISRRHSKRPVGVCAHIRVTSGAARTVG
eukprot:m.307285 g.307285  ORF g.307285 m.307285 type:complete len:407 (+) comp23022_c5_seq5:3825-5045(+)